MHLHRFFGPTAVLGRSKHILCCFVMDNHTNLLHLFSDKKTIIDCYSLDQQYTNIDSCRRCIENTAMKLFNVVRGPKARGEH